MSGRTSWVWFGCLLTVATARIVSTYPVFDHTADEPAHLAAGMEWLDKGRYTYQIEDPPLPQVAVAILPYIAGSRSHNRQDIFREGFAILNAGDHYDRTLLLARLGNLPFFWLAALILFLWTRQALGEREAVLSVFFFTFTPAILAHAGFATTDMAMPAALPAAAFAALRWMESPSVGRTVTLGFALAFGILSKFSFPAFFPALLIAGVAIHFATDRSSLEGLANRLRPLAISLAGALIVAALVVWAGYRFSFHAIPAPELFQGFQKVLAMNRAGWLSYLFGRYSHTGFWYYYPALLAFKTPLALIALLALGAVVCWGSRGKRLAAYWMPLVFAASILAVGPYNRVNIGVRHILPVYVPFSVIATLGAVRLWDSRRISGRILIGLLLLWFAGSSLRSHPDYLAYFNELAGDHPERIAVDSDLDWGQDAKRLAIRLKQLGATSVAVDPILIANPEAVHGYPPTTALHPEAPSPGWNAVSITSLKLTRLGLYDSHPEIVPWPERTAGAERIGKGTLLWYFPPESTSRTK